ncbi:hypothetical protein [Thermogemmatispora sp.]|uniref:hypothetical protein n=1 Tax=Thermogemmatispora sp. TaxID=1968838 RepID=UPI0035E43B43
MTQVPSDHEAESQEALVDLTKKLRKRERRLLQRLQKAQTARAKAVERLNRAQARLEKRTARLQRLEERLSLVRQQLQTLEGLAERTPAPVAQEETASVSSSQRLEFPTAQAVQEETASREDLSPGSSPSPREAAGLPEASDAVRGNPALSELQALAHLLLEEGRREEQLRAGWKQPEHASFSLLEKAETAEVSSSEQASAAPAPETPGWPAFDQTAEPGEGREPEWVSQLAIDESGPAPKGDEPELQTSAERSSVSPAETEQSGQQAPAAREARQQAMTTAERPRQAALYGFDEPPDLPESEDSSAEEADFLGMNPAALASSLLPASPAELVREARAAAEAAEEAARLAIERAAQAAARLELLPSGRHLVQELAEVEQAVAQASHAAEIAQTTARAVERWAGAIAPTADTSLPAQSTAESQLVQPAESQTESVSSSSEPAPSPTPPEEALSPAAAASAYVDLEPVTTASSPEGEQRAARSPSDEEQPDPAPASSAPEEERREPTASRAEAEETSNLSRTAAATEFSEEAVPAPQEANDQASAEGRATSKTVHSPPESPSALAASQEPTEGESKREDQEETATRTLSTSQADGTLGEGVRPSEVAEPEASAETEAEPEEGTVVPTEAADHPPIKREEAQAN